jgi:hypothetical protein
MTVVALTLTVPVMIQAQDSVRPKCPVENGLVATFSAGRTVSANPSKDSVREPTPASMAPFDTTWRFDIAERRWSRPFFAASIGLGWTDAGHALGTTTALDAFSSRKSSACAGVAIGMRDPTLVLKGVRGTVRLRADARSLTRSRGSVKDSTVPRR